MSTRLLVALLTLPCLATAVAAHETWVLPSRDTVAVGEEIRLDVTSGMSFPRLESPIQAERVATAAFRLGGTPTDLGLREVEQSSLVLRQAFASEGLATVWLQLAPKTLELTPAQVEEYLAEIAASEETRALWAAQQGKLPWKETYTKFTKTFVAVGDAASDTSWQEAVGADLEIVPRSHPCELRVGADLAVEVRYRSQPLPRFPVGLILEGSTGRSIAHTDDEGVATLPLTRAGRVLLTTVRLQFDERTQTWFSAFSTLTLSIAPR